MLGKDLIINQTLIIIFSCQSAAINEVLSYSAVEKIINKKYVRAK